MWRGSNWAAVVAGGSALAIGVAACGGSSGSSATPTNTVTVQTKTVTAASSDHGQAGAGSGASSQQGTAGAAGAGSGSGGIQRVWGGRWVQGVWRGQGGDRRLSALEPGQQERHDHRPHLAGNGRHKIGAFYGGVLTDGRWQIRSSAKSAYSANFTAHRDGEGLVRSRCTRAGRGQESRSASTPSDVAVEAQRA